MERIAPRCEMFGISPQPTDGLPAFDWSEDLRLDFGAQKEPDVWEVAAQQRWLHRVHRWEDTSCTQSGTAACPHALEQINEPLLGGLCHSRNFFSVVLHREQGRR